MRRRDRRARRGGALLAVLWLSAALAMIAFSVASRVRSETERTASAADGMQAKYLADAGAERAILYFLWRGGQRQTGAVAGLGSNVSAQWDPFRSGYRFEFPSGYAQVEVIPESARLDVNRATGEDLVRLLIAVGMAPGQATETAAAIIDWRMQVATGPFDSYYLQQRPSFRARHASIEETEELLFVKGMTPELFYGTYVRDAQGRLVSRGGFRDCVSTTGTTNQFDPGHAEPALLIALGAPPAGVDQIIRLRATRPITQADNDQIQAWAGVAASRLRIAPGNTIMTMRSTGYLKNANGTARDVRRTVEATVKFFGNPVDAPFHIIRWREAASATAGSSLWQ